MTPNPSHVVLAIVGILVLATVTPFIVSLSAFPSASFRCNTPATTSPIATTFHPLHEQNITGEGTKVAIIDATGFDTDAPRLKGQIAETQSFWPGHSISNDGRNGHGTASATIVATIAPNATLYLANFDESDGFIRAIGWAMEKDVDVIVAPVEFLGKPNDGSAPISRTVTEAMNRGVPVIAPTGNLAQKHWKGQYSGTGNLTFAPGDDRLPLRGKAKRVRVWLWWDAAKSNLTVSLYRTRVDAPDQRLVTSRPYPDDNVPTNELLAAMVGEGEHYLVINGGNGTAQHVELMSPTHRFETAITAGSIVAPASAKAVIAVGAFNRTTGKLMTRSSRGQTNDDRRSVDLVAPGRVWTESCYAEFRGTSVAASYTGGVVVLLHSVNASLSPTEIEHILQETATDTGVRGPDSPTGYGRINASMALAQVRSLAVENSSNTKAARANSKA